MSKTGHASITKTYGIHPLVAADVANAAARLALTTLPNTPKSTPLAVGHAVQQTDDGSLWILRALPASSAANWNEWAYDPATKAYVDSVAQGLDVKASVRTISTANITLSGTQTVNGVALIANDRILVAGQTLSQNNGIYVVAAGAWARAADANTSAKVTAGMYVLVTEGTQADSAWVLVSDDVIVLGTTPLTFSQFSGVGLAAQTATNTSNIATKADKATTLTAGAGLTGGGDLSANRSFVADVRTVFGRIGAVIGVLGDYAASLISNDSSVSGANVKLALEGLYANFQSVVGSTMTSVVYTAAATTLQASDAGKNVGINNAADNTLTVPPSVFAVGQVLEGVQIGAGRIQFLPGAGVTITSSMRLYSRTTGSPWSLYQRSTNVWELYGDLLT